MLSLFPSGALMNSTCMSIVFSLLFFLPLAAGAELNPLLEKTVKYNAIKVERVLSVDTVLIAGNEEVALIGIAGPRPVRKKEVERDEHGFIVPDNDPTTAFEEEALRAVKTMLEGRTVRLEFDIERRNDDNVLQAYVYLPDGRMANWEILRQGYADLKLRSPNLKYADQFRSAYREARRDMKGLQGQW